MAGQTSLCPVRGFETGKLEVVQEKSADETPKQTPVFLDYVHKSLHMHMHISISTIN